MNATKISGRCRRAGFTLVELLVVIGLMALLSTISIGGYFAASRGMKTRGAIQDTVSFLRHAMQTSLIDNVPVAVLFVNRFQGRKADGAEPYGTAIAVKMAGRITCVAQTGGKAVSGSPPGAMLIDEFADWNSSFSTRASKSTDEQGVRLYRMTDIANTAKRGLEGCSSYMKNWVGYIRMSPKNDEVLISATGKNGSQGLLTSQWCSDYNKPENDRRWGLGFHAKNDGVKIGGSNGWKAGDAYGMEMGSFDLPKGFIFGSKTPDANGKLTAASTAAIVFTPSDAKNANTYTLKMNGGSVAVYSLEGGDEGAKAEKIGDINDSDLKDQD